MGHLRGYPKWFTTRRLTLAVAALAASGLALVPTMLEMRLGQEVPWRLEANQRVWMASVHSAMSFGMTWILGALWTVHMRTGWRHRLRRRSGSSQAVLWGALTLTGVGIYYLGENRLSVGSSVLHSLLGVLALGAYALHVLIAKKTQK